MSGRVWDGGRFKVVREAAGYTTTDLGEIVGLTRQTIRNYEIGKTAPDPYMAARLADALGVPSSILYSSEPAGSSPT